MTTDWILRVGDGENFINSSKYGIWGVQTVTSSDGKYFIKNVRHGDRLWFVKSKSQGKVIAVATYKSHNVREIGPLVSLTMTNEELGWTGEGPDWTSDIELHYTNFYDVIDLDIFTHIKSPKTIRKYNEKCRVVLAEEYMRIIQ
jgi:hypothetical protein